MTVNVVIYDFHVTPIISTDLFPCTQKDYFPHLKGEKVHMVLVMVSLPPETIVHFLQRAEAYASIVLF